jgi:diguanylate cyclase (GGDEF)-like protein/PAS domain S-box-containing protein
MSRSEPRRRPSTAVQVVLGVILAGTGLYLVPTLALSGSVLAALVAAILWLGGAGAIWYLYRQDIHRGHRALAEERAAHDLYRSLVEHGGEAHLVVDEDGAVSFASPNTQDVLGVDADRLERDGRLLDMVDDRDRKRALRAYARVRHREGGSMSFEVAGRRPDGAEGHVMVRAVNLTGSPVVGGVLLIVRDITPRKTFETEIQHLAYYDALTGLANRRFFMEQGEKAISLARRHKEPLAVFYMDLDRFKQVNDTLGHEKGDELLEAVAASLEESLRETDIIARLGGDEFAVVLTEVRDEEAAGRVAHRVLENMPATVVEAGHELPVGASLGVAMFPDDADSLESLLKAADMAMYRAKSTEAGVQFYRPELRQMLSDQLRMEADMREALEHHEFHLHYQPVFHIMTGEMAGAEALSRWRHFSRGMVAASEFIQLAEKTGLIRSLDRWAIARAVHQRSTQLEGGWRGWVAVNLSPSSLRDPTLADYVRDTMEAAHLEPGSLVLELPEGAVFHDASAAADLMWELKNTGAAIALDDYGAGATSFSQLKKLPIDILKLHADFIAGIGTDAGDEHLVEATISIAHGIRAKVLAKGVERDDQVDWLRQSGCDFVQGYLMGAPMPAEELSGERDEPAEEPAGA